jgi:uncharacterized damage-inducible protein DinB
MTCSVAFDELLGYSDAERAKWKAWIAAEPGRLQLPFQPGGRFPTIGTLFDHIFLVERRHLARLEGGTPPETTGVPANDGKALFEYAELVRADFRRFLVDLDQQEAAGTLTFEVESLAGTFTMTRRKLVTHLLLHEVRHLAQLAYAARVAGQEPPGNHDLFYFTEFA